MEKKIYNPGIIIQARMESKRLPGKMMLKLAGKPLIYHIIERLKKCKKANKFSGTNTTPILFNFAHFFKNFFDC